MIYYRTIWDTGKNFGRAINRELSLIPDANDWVVLMDGDVMFLTDYWGKQIEDIISKNYNKYMVIGAMLSRCCVSAQLVGTYPSTNYNLIFHKEVAADRKGRYYDLVAPTSGPIAAACMIFQKKTWELCRGFKENTPHFDSMFCTQVRRNNGKLGVAQGLYLMHAYRAGIEQDPGSKYDHLIKTSKIPTT